MEIYKGTVPTVLFYLPTVDTTVNNVSYKMEGTGQEGWNLNFSVADGKAIATLPYLQNEGKLIVTWNFSVPSSGTYTEDSIHQVVTPILTLREIKEIDEDATDEEAAAIESAVRHIINAHTGQTFGKFVGVRRVSGSGDSNLRMPQRLVSLTDINGNTYWNSSLAIRGDGWFLASKHVFAPSVRADFDGWHYNSNEGAIVAPNSKVLNTFTKHAEYAINGVWGWEHVPNAVKEAAKLLVNDYSCGDIAYRDRFLTSMTAADWRIQFHEGAFSNTGNVRANQLLAEFVLRRGWVVI